MQHPKMSNSQSLASNKKVTKNKGNTMHDKEEKKSINQKLIQN